MREARCTVESRWAMTIDVRPRMSSAMPRSMARSVSGSTLAVASSRIEDLGIARQRPGEREQLPLAGREVGARAR